MTSHNMNDTPLELREIETRLLSLKPNRAPEVVRSVEIHTSTFREDLPRFADAASVKSCTRLVRRAQIQAGVFGMIVGSLFGIVLGGLYVYFAMGSLEFRRCSHSLLGEVARTSPVYAISVESEQPVPDSVKRILRYYDSITEEAGRIQAG